MPGDDEDRYECSSCTWLYVSNLSSRIRSRDLEHIFSRYGNVRDVVMKQGYAFVEFSKPRYANDARHHLDGTRIDGRRITVEFYTPRKRETIFQSETRIDFIQHLDEYVCERIMSFLDNPVDIVRASAVSRSWYRFVIANEFAKRACLKRIPGVTNIVGTSIMDKNRQKIDYCVDDNWKVLERNQKVYASLLLAINGKGGGLLDSKYSEVCASSTDKNPHQSIIHTTYEEDKLPNGEPSYWSSKGHENPDVPETLIYELKNGFVLSKIYIKPFQAFFQPGEPIYSARAVRFRVGHPKSPREFKMETRKYDYDWPPEESANDKFVWSYVSPAFPMLQENSKQLFKLPEPILCIGAYLQIELLGRVQRNETDGLFYLCVSYVQLLGLPLRRAFDIERTEPDKQLILKYYPKGLNRVLFSSNRTSYFELDMWFQTKCTAIAIIENMTQQEPKYCPDWNVDAAIYRTFDGES